ncbi:hypothetical protein ACFL5Z_18755 [Planctomycetota bacterium]
MKDTSAEVEPATESRLKALVDVLSSRGAVKILMNPTLEVVDGFTAKVQSSQDSLQITPSILEDGDMTLNVQATLGSLSITEKKEQARLSPGKSLVIGGMKKTEEVSETESDAEDVKEQRIEVMLIITPTIVSTAPNPQKETDDKEQSAR